MLFDLIMLIRCGAGHVTGDRAVDMWRVERNGGIWRGFWVGQGGFSE